MADIPSRPREPRRQFRHHRGSQPPSFAHPSEERFARVLAMKQSRVPRKNRKLRRLASLHGVVVTVRYRRDLERLGWSYTAGA